MQEGGRVTVDGELSGTVRYVKELCWYVAFPERLYVLAVTVVELRRIHTVRPSSCSIDLAVPSVPVYIGPLTLRWLRGSERECICS